MARVKGSQRDAEVAKAQQQPEFPLPTQTGKDASPEPEKFGLAAGVTRTSHCHGISSRNSASSRLGVQVGSS